MLFFFFFKKLEDKEGFLFLPSHWSLQDRQRVNKGHKPGHSGPWGPVQRAGLENKQSRALQLLSKNNGAKFTDPWGRGGGEIASDKASVSVNLLCAGLTPPTLSLPKVLGRGLLYFSFFLSPS